MRKEEQTKELSWRASKRSQKTENIFGETVGRKKAGKEGVGTVMLYKREGRHGQTRGQMRNFSACKPAKGKRKGIGVKRRVGRSGRTKGYSRRGGTPSNR